MAMYSLFDLAAEEQGLLDPEDVQPLPERPAQKYDPDQPRETNGTWANDHAGLVREALGSWRGGSADMMLHMADERAGVPVLPSATARMQRERAAALNYELENNPQTNDVPLYRGDHRAPQGDQSWSENRAVAEHWAKLGGGTVHELAPGKARGIRASDHGVDWESEWVVRTPDRATKYEQYRVSEHDLVEQFLRAMLPATPDGWRAKYRDQEPTLHRLIAETVERALPAGVRPDTAASLRALGDRWLAKYGPDMIERVVTPYLADADAETTAALVAASWERVVQPMVRRLLSFGGLVAAAHRAIKFDPNQARDETGKWTKGGGAAPGKTNEGTPPGRRKYFPSEAGSPTSPHAPQGQDTMEAQGQNRLPNIGEMTERPPKTPEERAIERRMTRSTIMRTLQTGEVDPDTVENISNGTSGVYVAEIDGQKVVIKPDAEAGANAGGQRLRGGIKPGNDAGRELAAQIINDAMGGYVQLPAVTTRMFDEGIGDGDIAAGDATVTEFREGSHIGREWGSADEEAVNRVALFDAVIGNTDRHGNNALLSDDGELIPIDHGLAFPKDNEPEWGNAQAIEWRIENQGDALDDEEVALLTQLADDPALSRQLGKHLRASEVDALYERLHHMIRERTLFQNIDRSAPPRDGTDEEGSDY